VTESCWRCGAEMEWRHGTWQCARCRFKLGCCEGEPQSTAAADHSTLAVGCADGRTGEARAS